MLKAIFDSRPLVLITLFTAGLVTAVCTRPADSAAAASQTVRDSAPANVELPPDSAHEMILDAGARAPFIRSVAGVPQLVLPASFQQALASAHPDFRPYHRDDFQRDVLEYVNRDSSKVRALFAVVADFDGNGRDDVALLGETRTHMMVLAALDLPEGVRVVTVDSSGVIDRKGAANWLYEYLDRHEPERLAIPDFTEGPGKPKTKPDTLDLAHPGVEQVIFEKASTLWYWNGKAFRGVVTAD